MIKSLSPCRYADIVFYTFNYLDKKCPCFKNLYFHENNNIHKMEADLPEKLYSLPKICKSTCTYVYISRDLYGHHNKDKYNPKNQSGFGIFGTGLFLLHNQRKRITCKILVINPKNCGYD